MPANPTAYTRRLDFPLVERTMTGTKYRYIAGLPNTGGPLRCGNQLVFVDQVAGGEVVTRLEDDPVYDERRVYFVDGEIARFEVIFSGERFRGHEHRDDDGNAWLVIDEQVPDYV